MPINCAEMARIIGGKATQENDICVVQRVRKLSLKIMDEQVKSPAALSFSISSENLSPQGKTVNLGETIVTEEEINPFISGLRRRGLIVGAVHSHWIFQNRPFKYVHWESVGDPVEFAKASMSAARDAKIFD